MGDFTLRTHLLNELTYRKTRNSSYSLRAFARDLGVGSTTLSDYLAQKRTFSPSNLKKVLERLSVSPAMKDKFFLENKSSTRTDEVHAERVQVEEDTFRLISDWYYLAILNLAGTKNAKAEPQWIANRLGLSLPLAEEALQRLLRLKMVTIEGNRLKRASKYLKFDSPVPSAAVRKHHAQNLHLAEKSLLSDPMEKRDFGSFTVACNLENLEQAKKILLKASSKVADLLSEGDTTEVYKICFQLFPVTQTDGESGEK